jgi:hypothetical protein
MYLEFLLLIADYFRTLKWRCLIFEWVLPLLIGVVAYLLVAEPAAKDLAKKFDDTAVTLLGVLIGFSITVITIMHTSSNKNIEEIKGVETEYKIGTQPLYLFHLILINLTYSVILEVLCLICNLCLLLVWDKIDAHISKILLSINLFFILHILLLNLRNITDFYFILFKGQSQSGQST